MLVCSVTGLRVCAGGGGGAAHGASEWEVPGGRVRTREWIEGGKIRPGVAGAGPPQAGDGD